MENKLIKELKFLKIYCIILTLAIAFLLYKNIYTPDLEKFKEIDVERINIKEKNGDLKLVISNNEMQDMGSVNGQKLPKRERAAGLIFFNSDGDECGGLIYDGNSEEAVLVLSVDKYQDDQVMQLQYMEDTKNDQRKYGLQLWEYGAEDGFSRRMELFEKYKSTEDQEEKKIIIKKLQDEGLLMQDRLFVGKKMTNEFGLFINDSNGKPRIKIYVDKNNNAKLEFLDEEGNVINKN